MLWERTIQLVGVGMTLLATLTAVVSTADTDWSGLLAVVPVVVLLLWALAARMLHEFFYIMAFKDYAEIKMYRDSGQAREGFSTWHVAATPAMVRGLPNIAAYGVIALFSLSLVSLSMLQLWEAQPGARVWIAIEASAVCIGLGVVGYALHRTVNEVKSHWVILDRELE